MRLLSSIIVFFTFAYVSCALPYGSPIEVRGQSPSPELGVHSTPPPENAEHPPPYMRNEIPYGLGLTNCNSLNKALQSDLLTGQLHSIYKAPGPQKDYLTTFEGDKHAVITEISVTGSASREQLFSDVHSRRIPGIVAFGSEQRRNGKVVYFVLTSSVSREQLCIQHWKE
ncbi:hypothetical protein APHAL10511_000793 [Amanita phalloides]|nr:hypothetical protein APHAL10511_000793 [Amanita phalloides]